VIALTAPLVEAFSGTFLSPMYDQPAATPPFHREGWELYCSERELCGVIAPRGHAKSTAFTHDYILANLLFRSESYIIIVSATEDLAKDHLGDIARVLREDDDVIKEFGIAGMPVDAKTEIIVKFSDGHEARILAKGSGQKMRGLKWKGRRPGLIVGDDLEEDEQVESADRRAKFRKWVFRALLPCRRKGGKVRIHGTILHDDSLLKRLWKPPVKSSDETRKTWTFRFYKAHAGFDDFSEILWPEAFDEERLRDIRQGYIDQQDVSGYSQEYLNDPSDSSDAYLRREWFLPMGDGDFESPKIVCAAADFAISKKDKANRTSLTVGGKDVANLVSILDQRIGRWDSLEIVDEIFELNETWHPDIFWVESGQIWLSIWPIIKKEMAARNRWINFIAKTPIQDKATRGRAYQRRLRGGGMRFPHEAFWFADYLEENLKFTPHAEALLDDQFDSTALLMAGFEGLAELDEGDFAEDETPEERDHDPKANAGRNQITGY
jgi:hypothetical protein